MTLRPFLFGLVVSTILAANLEWGCQDSHVKEQCRVRYCRNLNVCGLLPSPFGTEADGVDAFENCVARCELTQPSALSIVDECLSKGSPNDFDWCQGSNSQCSVIASCLTQRMPDAGVLGHTRLTLAVDSNVVPQYRSREICVGQTAGAGNTPGATADPGDAGDWCQQFNAARVVPFVLQSGKRVVAPEMACSTLLAAPVVFSSLSPGCARAGVEVRIVDTSLPDAGDAGPGERLFCYVLYAGAEKGDASVQKVELFAGRETRATVGLPTAGRFLEERKSPACLYECEYPPLCSDGQDNDGDELTDCADPGCDCGSPIDAGTATRQIESDAGDASRPDSPGLTDAGKGSS